MSPIGELCLLAQLVFSGHDPAGEEPGERDTSKDDEDVLRDEAPRRVGSSEEGGLLDTISVGIVKTCLQRT